MSSVLFSGSNPRSLGQAWLPVDLAWLAWTCHPWMANQILQPTAGVAYYGQVMIPESLTVTTVGLIVSQAASGGSPANMFVGVFNQAGVRQGVCTDRTASFATSGQKACTMVVDGGKSLTFTGGPGVWMWVGLLVGTQSSTPGQFRSVCSSGITASFGNSPGWVSGTLGTSLTALPTTFDPLTLSSNAGPILYGLV